MPFNVNHTVFVRLTDYGRQILRDKYAAIYAGDLLEKYPYEEPKENLGWSEWQLWGLMNSFGEFMDMGGELPFETTIEIETT